MTHEFKTLPFEVTALDATGRTVEGYAAVFGNLDAVGDIIHAGAFRKTLTERGPQIKFLWQHAQSEPLGKVLEAREDGRGLFIKAIVSDTSRGRDALALLRDGAIGGLSIGYDAVKGGTDYETRDNQTIRNLKEIRLYECSLVTMPANSEAGVTALKDASEAKKVDITENSVRVRVQDPSEFDEATLRTIDISADEGIQAVVGKKPGADSMEIQTYIFDKTKWPPDKAEQWVADHRKDGPPPTETKIGRTISRATHGRMSEAMAAMKSAMETLSDLMDAAGIGDDAPGETEGDEGSTAPAAKRAADHKALAEAGPVTPPTSTELLRQVEIELAECSYLEV
jgi:HK97 family phage prohead protease